ncbi:hypothetical protein GCM10027037_33690 [Mucilaginibacter koreensis]
MKFIEAMSSLDRTFWALIIGIVGGLFLIISAIFQYKDKKTSDREADEAKRQASEARIEAGINAQHLLTAQREVIALQREANTTSAHIAAKAEELADSYKRNAELQEQLTNELTGGGTTPILYIYATPYAFNNGVNNSIQVHFVLKNNGKYSLSDVKVQVSDMLSGYMSQYYTVLNAGIGGTMGTQPGLGIGSENQWNPVKTFNLGTLQPGSQNNFYTALIPNYPVTNIHESAALNPGWPVNVRWNAGTLDLYTNFKWSINHLKLGTVEAVLNQKIVQSEKFIEYESFLDRH